MSFLNPLLLYGLPLVALPVLLHLLMRTKPKKLLFPALRLIQARRKNNVRRMRLRHIWLLLLRMLVIAALVLAVARPSLPAADYSPSFGEWLTLVAIALLAIGAYIGVLRYWRRQRWPNHVYTYRRSVLRGGTSGVAVLLFLLLVLWPYQRRIAAEIAAPLPSVAENLPVAGVFLFDASLSMQYRLENKTRLDRAKEIATEHLSNLPPQSRIAVADTGSENPVLFQADISGAHARIEALEIRPVAHALNDRLRAALRLQEEDRGRTLGDQAAVPEQLRQDRFLREVYIFTDLAQTGWRMSAAKTLHDLLSRLDWIHVYIIDVGVAEPTNVAITNLALSRQTVPAGGELIVQASLSATGNEQPQQTIELYVQNEDGQLVKQNQSSVALGGEAGGQVTFSVPSLNGPLGRGEVRLSSSDPLAADDVRYFTVEVRPPTEVLLVAESRAESVYWQEALAPAELVRQKRARYRCSYLSASSLEGAEFTKYDVLCLINVQHPSQESWRQLARFVDAGGGLAVFLGMPNNSNRPPPVSYNSLDAQAILPAELLAELPFRPPEYIDLENLAHPLLSKFDQFPGRAALLTSSAVRRYWRVKPSQGGSVIAGYTDRRNSPALLERAAGDGRTVMLTTAVDLKLRSPSWNDLPLAQWQFVALADQMMQYLSRQTESVFNYTAGDEVVLRLKQDETLTKYLLRKPKLQQLLGELPPGASSIVVRDADQLGHYEVVGAEQDSTYASGFSVNPPPGESDFSRLAEADLDRLFGEGRYSVAPTIEDLERVVTRGRIGQEAFPLVLLVMLVVFCTEHLVANRFYEADQAVSHK